MLLIELSSLCCFVVVVLLLLLLLLLLLFVCLFSHLKGEWTEDTNWPERRRNCANVFICRLQPVVLSVIVQKIYFFRFEFELLGTQPYWFPLQMKSGQWLIHDVFDWSFLPQRQALFVTSLIQPAGQKIAVAVVLFARLWIVDFQQDEKSSENLFYFCLWSP